MERIIFKYKLLPGTTVVHVPEGSIVRPNMGKGSKNLPGEACEICGAAEVDAMTPRTVYACGSSDYDKRPGTFRRGGNCNLMD